MATKKEKIGRIVQQELTRAEGGQSDELQANRETAMKYYHRQLPAPVTDEKGQPLDGRSAYVDGSVAATVNATLAMMREMLILDAELIIEPEGEEDEDAAKAESSICTDVLLKDNQGELVILQAIKDGLLLRDGCIKVRMTDGGCHVDGVPIEHISYTANFSGDLQDIPFFAERIDYTRSELVEMGLKRSVVNRLPSGDDTRTGTELARNVTYELGRDGETPDQDRIKCHEAYILADLDDDGISERYVCLVADDGTCLEYEPADVIPYALGTPILRSHRLTGESLFDHLRPIQDGMTALQRQWEDNVNVINNGRYIYDPSRVDEGDIFEPIAGGGIRARDVTAVVPLMVPDVSGGIMLRVEDMRRQRSEHGGGALDMASAEAQVANKAATVASIEKGNQELLSAWIASTYAKTMLVDVYKLIHFNLSQYADRTYLARINGQAVPVDPRQWPARNRMYVRCGATPSQKAQQNQALGMHVQLQGQAMMNGLDGVIASPETLFRTQEQWLKSNGIQNAESLIIDPASPAAQQAMQAKQAQEQAMQQQMAEVQQMQQQLSAQLEQAKLAEDARQHDGDLQFKYHELAQKIEAQEAELAASGTIDLEKERMKHEQADKDASRQAAAAAEGSDADSGGTAA